MKLYKLIPALFALFCFGMPIFAQQPYAHWAGLRDNMPDGAAIDFENMKLNTPDKNMVELPVYPGAKIVATSQETEGVDESSHPQLATVTLISSDPVDKVISVYQDIIKDFPKWHWNSNMKIFYKGNLQEALNLRAPYILVTPINSMEPEFKYISSNDLASASSKIVVCYNPSDVSES
jgi:hypothetical protein